MTNTTRINEKIVSLRTTCCDRRYDIWLTIEQEKAWREGALIQKVAPELSPATRELLVSGMCSECFDKVFGPYDSKADYRR